MAVFVTPQWTEERLDCSSVLVLDCRRPMRYLQGHLKTAVNLPAARLLDADGRLLDERELVARMSASGLDAGTTPLLYDSHDGRNAAMVAWALEYLGRRDVYILDMFYEGWLASGHEVFYKPVTRPPSAFAAQVDSQVRATTEEIARGHDRKLLDLRSAAEYFGEDEPDGAGGHLPGAINVVWQDLLGGQQGRFFDAERVHARLASAGIGPGDAVTAYCRRGPRAAIGYLFLSQLGYDVSLFDGSYAEWLRRGLPLER